MEKRTLGTTTAHLTKQGTVSSESVSMGSAFGYETHGYDTSYKPVKTTKKPVLFFTTADANNEKYAQALERSFKHFHPDIPFHTVKGEELQSYLKDDPAFFYRQKPILGEKYLKEYELVIGIDADSIILGDLSYLWETKDYDIAGVLNYNELDAKQFGMIGGWGILPIEYMNCGLVAMRNEQFVHNWNVWCHSPQFERLHKYREQDGLNALVYHGNWNVRILDHGDGPAGMHALWGLFGKTYWNRTVLKDKKVIIPASGNPNVFPPMEMEIKIAHMGGGGGTKKDNWGIYFPEEVYQYIQTLIK